LINCPKAYFRVKIAVAVLFCRGATFSLKKLTFNALKKLCVFWTTDKCGAVVSTDEGCEERRGGGTGAPRANGTRRRGDPAGEGRALPPAGGSPGSSETPGARSSLSERERRWSAGAGAPVRCRSFRVGAHDGGEGSTWRRGAWEALGALGAGGAFQAGGGSPTFTCARSPANKRKDSSHYKFPGT